MSRKRGARFRRCLPTRHRPSPSTGDLIGQLSASARSDALGAQERYRAMLVELEMGKYDNILPEDFRARMAADLPRLLLSLDASLGALDTLQAARL
ncbi:MAG: hypothetical protein E6J14_08190 [Chloroflexi bacterium]|nr:MAG: hypothetical protein E6J14_08190 [Chloroflexota bacterium]